MHCSHSRPAAALGELQRRRHVALQLATRDGAAGADRLRRGPRVGPPARAEPLASVLGGGRAPDARLSAPAHAPQADRSDTGALATYSKLGLLAGTASMRSMAMRARAAT